MMDDLQYESRIPRPDAPWNGERIFFQRHFSSRWARERSMDILPQEICSSIEHWHKENDAYPSAWQGFFFDVIVDACGYVIGRRCGWAWNGRALVAPEVATE